MAGGLAAWLRYELPLAPHQLPTITSVIAVAVVTSFVGTWAGIATAATGGLLSWYMLLGNGAAELTGSELIPLLGFSVIATVIIVTSSLFRRSEQRQHDREMTLLTIAKENAELFSRELSHRLKNALTIVQSVAFQTFGHTSAEAQTFSSRLKTLADANQLLSEHISRPVADVRDVVRGALELFDDQKLAIKLECTECAIPDQQVISLALAVHELGTNAIKHGAWSTVLGSVTLLVEDAGEHLRLVWEETGGPRVEPPTSIGFGSRLMARAGREPIIDYASGGLRYSVLLRRA
jgi:two-component sensor histidine kinase